jgi:hypothetical protein
MERKASEAMLMHKTALIELGALSDLTEPDWGGEREITEKYLEQDKNEKVDRDTEENKIMG